MFRAEWHRGDPPVSNPWASIMMQYRRAALPSRNAALVGWAPCHRDRSKQSYRIIAIGLIAAKKNRFGSRSLLAFFI